MLEDLGMALKRKKSIGRSSAVSPGSLGGKIKRYRELRGWTQKELGIRCGFTESTADVRIAQYEKNTKIPREDALKRIAEALQIDAYTLFDADLASDHRMYHALFDIEDFHGLHPVRINDKYYLGFDDDSYKSRHYEHFYIYKSFIEKWYEMREKYQPKVSDSPEEKEEKAREYALWRGEYPLNIAKENTERILDGMRMRELQAEMDALNAKMKNDEELEKIDKALDAVMPEVRTGYKPIRRESDFIYLIKQLIEEGLCIEQYSPEVSFEEIGTGDMHLLSVRSESILNDEKVRTMFAHIVCAIETIRQYGVDVYRKITCRNNEFYVSYFYLSEQYIYFNNLRECWNDILYIYERKENWTDWELAPLEERLRADITGEKDVLFSGK